MELVGFGESEGADLLQKLPLFSKLTFEETQRLAQIATFHEVKPGAVVIEQNALGDGLYIVVKGEVSVSRDRDHDGQHSANEVLGKLGPGELFGEMSLVDDLLTSARVTADTATRLLKLPRREFEGLMSADDRLALKVYRSFCRTLSDRLRKSNLQVTDKLLHVTLR
ncbi:MAG: Crp/Fnr family transcriptional regulator [Myxococcaceae bacterium]